MCILMGLQKYKSLIDLQSFIHLILYLTLKFFDPAEKLPDPFNSEKNLCLISYFYLLD